MVIHTTKCILAIRGVRMISIINDLSTTIPNSNQYTIDRLWQNFHEKFLSEYFHFLSIESFPIPFHDTPV